MTMKTDILLTDCVSFSTKFSGDGASPGTLKVSGNKLWFYGASAWELVTSA